MTTLASYYALAAQAPIQHRRYALGAAYQIQQRVGWGESISSARSRVMSVPQYANALVAAGLDDDYALVDSTGGGGQVAVATNLATNPSFEVDTSGWVTNDGAVMVITGATLTRVTTDAQDRTAVGQVATTALSQGASHQLTGQTFASGQAYTASFYARTTTGTLTGRIIFGDTSGDWIIPANIGLTTTWQRFTATWTPAAARTNVALAIRSQLSGSFTYQIDAVMVEAGSAASAYFDGASANSAWRGTADASISDRFA